MSEKLFSEAAELIRNSKKTVALTGAGISTPSGIPVLEIRLTAIRPMMTRTLSRNSMIPS